MSSGCCRARTRMSPSCAAGLACANSCGRGGGTLLRRQPLWRCRYGLVDGRVEGVSAPRRWLNWRSDEGFGGGAASMGRSWQVVGYSVLLRQAARSTGAIGRVMWDREARDGCRWDVATASSGGVVAGEIHAKTATLRCTHRIDASIALSTSKTRLSNFQHLHPHLHYGITSTAGVDAA